MYVGTKQILVQLGIFNPAVPRGDSLAVAKVKSQAGKGV